jgi:pyruvate carboxylase
VRLDAGTAYTGAFITRWYDSLLVKVTTWAPTPAECSRRMHRALWEFRIRGVTTNLRFLDQVVTHPSFADGSYTTKFIDQTPELFQWPRRRDRATRLLGFIGEVIVNGNPEVDGPAPAGARAGAEAARGACRRAARRAAGRSWRSAGRRASRSGCSRSSRCW